MFLNIVYIYTHAYIHICIYIHIQIHPQTHRNIHIHRSTQTHIYIYTYTYTLSQPMYLSEHLEENHIFMVQHNFQINFASWVYHVFRHIHWLENMVNGNHLRPISHWAVHRTLRPEENSMHNQSIWLHRSFLALPSRGNFPTDPGMGQM